MPNTQACKSHEQTSTTFSRLLINETQDVEHVERILFCVMNLCKVCLAPEAFTED